MKGFCADTKTRHCFADDGEGTSCLLPKGHKGPHGWELPDEPDDTPDYHSLPSATNHQVRSHP